MTLAAPPSHTPCHDGCSRCATLYLLLVEDALNALCATVWTNSILVQPLSETGVAEMFTAAFSEASIPQDFGTDATDVLGRDSVHKLVVASSMSGIARPVFAAAVHWREGTRCT